MKSFVLIMLVSVGIATVAAVVIVRAIFPETASGTSALRQTGAQTDEYTQQGAVETVIIRLSSSPQAEQMKQTLRDRAQVSYHSQRHWTVRLDSASWTAHGTGTEGPYAEPDNDAAKRFEAAATGS